MIALHAREIFSAALRAADPAQAVRSSISRDALTKTFTVGEQRFRVALSDDDGTKAWSSSDDASRVVRGVTVVGAGKAMVAMAKEIHGILGDLVEGGLVVTKDGHAEGVEGGCIGKIVVEEAAHPVPDERGAKAAGKMLALLQETDPRSLVVALLSGGGSSLLAAPAEGSGIAMGDLRDVTEVWVLPRFRRLARAARSPTRSPAAPPLAVCYAAVPQSMKSTPSAST